MTDSLRLAVGDEIFTRQRRGGISRYFVELIKAFRASDDGVQVLSTWQWVTNDHALEAGIGRRLPAPLGTSGRLARAANFPRHRLTHADVWHLTYYGAKKTRLTRNALRVVTLYDMIPERFPELFPSGSPHRGKREMLERADLILSISRSAADDLANTYDVKAPIRVTHLGVGSPFVGGNRRTPGLPKAYILFVGRRGGYKDFKVLLAAYIRLAATHPKIVLLVVGGGKLAHQEMEGIPPSVVTRIVQMDLDDAQLASAYEHALCFIFPSRYEGFGLPTLEAMAVGCPVILAKSSSHPEVGGAAALYFTPGSVDELEETIRDLLQDPARRQRIGQISAHRAAGMSWGQTAAATLSAYREFL